MTITYILQDGGKITATCAADFVTKLRESSRFDSECTDQEYMYHSRSDRPCDPSRFPRTLFGGFVYLWLRKC